MSNSSNSTVEGISADQDFSYLIEGVILTIVSLFGFGGNFMSIFVLISVKGSFSNLLCGLACFDTLFLLMAILAFGLPKLSVWYSNNVFLQFMSVSFGLLHTFRVGSVSVTLAVNFDRFCAIMFPFKHFRIKKFLLPLCVSFTVIYNLPKYFEMEIKFSSDGSATIETTELRRNPLYMSLYVFWSKFILVEVIPYISIIIFNICIIVKTTKSHKFKNQFITKENKSGSQLRGCIRCQSQRHESISRRNIVRKEERHLVLTLTSLSCIFIICQSLKIIPDLYELIWCNPNGTGGNCPMEGIVDHIIHLSHLMVCVNSSVNFLIYYISGHKIRHAWIETYGLSCIKPKASQQVREHQLCGFPNSKQALTVLVAPQSILHRNNESSNTNEHETQV